jgi:hypothetical protein
MTIRLAGTVSVSTASRLVQNGVSGRPGTGPRVEQDRPPGLEGLFADHDVLRSLEATPAPHHPSALPLEPAHRCGVVPVVGGLFPDAPGHRGEVGLDHGVAGHAIDPAPLGQQVGRPDHHLGRDTAPVGALAADQLGVDADDVQARLGEPRRGEFTAGAEPEHDHVRGLHREPERKALSRA